MSEFQIRSDSIDVEQIMRQIRARIREKRGADYTEQEIRELAAAKLEKFLDPSGVRSDLLEHFHRARHAAAQQAEPPINYEFDDKTLYDSHRPIIKTIRRLLSPILKLFINHQTLTHVLHLQARSNAQLQAADARRRTLDALYYEVLHNLVVETTRMGIEVKNLRMRLESISSRLDFDERRARALEGVVQYRPGVLGGSTTAARPPAAQPPSSQQPQQHAQPPQSPSEAAGISERRARRRRRRGRRRHGHGQGAQAAQGAQGAHGAQPGEASTHSHPEPLAHPEHPEHARPEPLEHPRQREHAGEDRDES
jgi:hypothetical protein